MSLCLPLRYSKSDTTLSKHGFWREILYICQGWREFSVFSRHQITQEEVANTEDSEDDKNWDWT